MTGDRRSGPPLAALRRVTRVRPAPVVEERCDLCAAAVGPAHSHLVDLDSRALMCACRSCYLLFTDEHAALRYRAVPDRYLSFPGIELGAREWDELQIPVGLAFLFHNSVLNRLVAFYPGPAGATESELSLEAWARTVAEHPRLRLLRPDVEALLIRSEDREHPGSVHLVPVDACYELVGRLRTLWRGFDGGQDARDAIEEFFTDVEERSRPARPVLPGGAP